MKKIIDIFINKIKYYNTGKSKSRELRMINSNFIAYKTI